MLGPFKFVWLILKKESVYILLILMIEKKQSKLH